MTNLKRTKIVCTVGPATEDDDVLRDMMREGMNVARLNFSHGTHEYHRMNIERVRRIASELGVNVAIMVDTKGPEIRTRLNRNHELLALIPGNKVRITSRLQESTKKCISVDYDKLASEVGPGDTIFMDDGLIGFRVLRVEGDEIVCVITNGGMLGERKGVNVPNVYVDLPSVTDQDKLDIRFACEMQVDAVAASFVRDADAVREIRSLCQEYGAPDMTIISKIESAFAVDNFDDILAESDGIMVARGDLGVEIPPADVPYVQKQIIQKCNEGYKPVITATQMLDSMVNNPRPTRAEVTDVANAIYDGTDCVMLSGETAAGKYPVESVRMMADVCRNTEEHLVERNVYHDMGGLRNVSGAMGYSAVRIAKLVEAKALVCPTLSGRSARIMSAFRPHLPIIATAPLGTVIRRTCFYWGVEAIPAEEQGGVIKVCYHALSQVRKTGLLEKDDLVVITAGDPLSSPMLEGHTITSETSTNLCLVAQVF